MFIIIVSVTIELLKVRAQQLLQCDGDLIIIK